MSLYSSSYMIARFSQGIGFSNTRHRENIILEPYSKLERANMATTCGSSTPYFYLHLPVIYELGILIPFTPFEVDFLVTINVTPSHITSNVWSFLRAPKNFSCNLGMTLTVLVFFYFFWVETLPICG